MIVNEIGIASLAATAHEGAPPAVTVIGPKRGDAPIWPSQLITTGGEHIADADGAEGDDEEPDPQLANKAATVT
jgi:hypothetical protein